MAQVLIRIAAKVDAGYPVELLELRTDGTTASLATGLIPAAIDGGDAANVLVEKTPASGLPEAGLALHAALAEGLGAQWQQQLDGAESTIYFDVEPGELQKVPWEVLHWPKTIGGGSTTSPVAGAHHLVRLYKPSWETGGPVPEGPLRMLIVVGASPDDKDVQPQAEIDEIIRKVRPVERTIDLEVLTDYGELYEKIRQFRPQILHFIGHGTAQRLEFAKKGSVSGWDWEASQIAIDVARDPLDGWRPNLVFLNACRTGRAVGELGPLAGAFLEAGALASIAMQGNIKAEAAGRLAGVFYEGVATGLPVDRALSKARAEVRRADDSLQASYAVLTLRCHPACVFPQFATSIPDYQGRARSCRLLPKLKLFVDQVAARRQLCGWLWPFRAGELPNKLILIRGEEGFGKTVLSTWLLDLSALLGHRVRYVAVGESAGVDYVTILQAIWQNRRPGLVSPLLDPLPLQGENLGELLAKSKDPTVLYPAFREALAELARERPVMLVLDEFGKQMEYNSFWVFWEHLLVPLQRSDINVNVILVLSEDDYKFYKIKDNLDHRWDLPAKEEVRLEELKNDAFAELLIEYLEYRSEQFGPALPTLRELAAKIKIRPPIGICKLEHKASELAEFIGFQLD